MNWIWCSAEFAACGAVFSCPGLMVRQAEIGAPSLCPLTTAMTAKRRIRELYMISNEFLLDWYDTTMES